MANKQISELEAKTTPANSDLFLLADSASSFKAKKITAYNLIRKIADLVTEDIEVEFGTISAEEVDEIWNS